MVKTKHLIYGAALAAAAVGTTKIIKYKTLSDKVDVKVEAAPENLYIGGVDIRLNITLINPTDYEFNILHPVITFMYGGKELLTSVEANINYPIRKNESVKFQPVIFRLNFLELASKAPLLVKDVRVNKGIVALLKVHTKIDKFISVYKEIPVRIDFNKIKEDVLIK